jgi:RimJ/RimL family protein N-acetyltransferase
VRLYAEVYAHNKASMQVLRNNGFYLEGIHRKCVFKNDALLDEYVWVKILER